MSNDVWAAPPNPRPRGPAAGPPTDDGGFGRPPGTVGSWNGAPPGAGTNPWAVFSLVSGLLALVPIAVVSGAVALVGLRNRPRRGQALAVAGLVAAAAWSIVVAIGLVVLATEPGFVGGALGRVADVPSATRGTCLQQAGEQGDVAGVVGCDGPHDAEVYAVVALPPGPWPGYDTLDDLADDECGGARYESYVGASYEESDFDYGWFASDEAEWRAGQRQVVCVVLPAFGDLTGSARGSQGLSD